MSTGAGLAGISEESPFIPFPSRRSVVHSTRGIVSCTNPLAAQAGLDILREGGNAAVQTLEQSKQKSTDSNMANHALGCGCCYCRGLESC